MVKSTIFRDSQECTGRISKARTHVTTPAKFAICGNRVIIANGFFEFNFQIAGVCIKDSKIEFSGRADSFIYLQYVVRSSFNTASSLLYFIQIAVCYHFLNKGGRCIAFLLSGLDDLVRSLTIKVLVVKFAFL